MRKDSTKITKCQLITQELFERDVENGRVWWDAEKLGEKSPERILRYGSELEEKAGGEDDVVLGVSADGLAEAGRAGVEIADFGAEGDGDAERTHDGLGVKAATKEERTRIGALLECRVHERLGFEETGVAASEEEPGFDWAAGREFHAEMRREEEKGVLARNRWRGTVELDVEGRSEEVAS